MKPMQLFVQLAEQWQKAWTDAIAFWTNAASQQTAGCCTEFVTEARAAPPALLRYAALSASNLRMISGSRSMASNNARAGASGVLRRCSQSRKVVMGR